MYGNYHRYYGYRNAGGDQNSDARVDLFQKEWFEGKDVLDVGCNSGHVTCLVARDLKPKSAIGVDIDGDLIHEAYKGVKKYLEEDQLDFPPSIFERLGRLPPILPDDQTVFPFNIHFTKANYVLESDDLLEFVVPEYDVILCLSLTKWIHLNWGDDGLKRFFKRCFKNLRPGGCLIVEVQPFSSYIKKKSKQLIWKENFRNIKLLPDKFSEYLLSSEVGFSSHESIGVSANESKGFQRPIFRYLKASQVNGKSVEDHGKKVATKRRGDVDDQEASSSKRTFDVDLLVQ